MANTVTRPIETVDGPTLHEMFKAGTAWLESQAESINALNVFPVPDGDTGTNMRLTMIEALSNVQEASPESDVSEVTRLMARGALMGARGNSGVILSQILRGFARAVEGKETIGPGDWGPAFQEASNCAYKAVASPTEGTILTVIREVGEATAKITDGNISQGSMLDLACSTAKDSVEKTTSMLAILQANGVVDAGGHGLSVILEGMAAFLRGDEEQGPISGIAVSKPGDGSAKSTEMRPSGRIYGFCTEFFVEQCTVYADDLRLRLEAMAESVVVVGEDGFAKVHLHTMNPDPIVDFANSFGKVSGLKVDNIDEQHAAFVGMHQGVVTGKAGVIAVVAGDGLVELFRGLGASAIVSGGQTMNPSAEQIARIARELPWENIFILPNSKNVVLAAQQAAELAIGKTIHVVPTADAAAGIAVMMAFNYEMELEANAQAMEQVLRSVKTGEVTVAVRDAVLDDMIIKKGQAIGLSSGKLTIAEAEVPTALEKLAALIVGEDDSVLTVYYGANISQAEANQALTKLKVRFPMAEVQVYNGGQDHYHYLLSVE